MEFSPIRLAVAQIQNVSHSRCSFSFRNTATSTFTHNRLTERPIEHLCPTQPNPIATCDYSTTYCLPYQSINALQLANDILRAASRGHWTECVAPN